MAGIAEFLQTTVGEALKGVLQPAGTLAGLLFTLLNLAFIYPAALDHRAGWALSFASLDTGWQALVVAVVSLGLGYLILASTDSIATLLAGHATRGSLVSDLLRHWHTRRADRWRTDPTRADVFRRYPASSEIQPTSFGNFIAAGNTIAKDRFGFDLVALWSQLSATAALEKSPALAAARTEKAALDLLGNLTFVLTVFSVEMLAFYAARDESRTALLGLVALAAAALVYRVAVAKARSWADALDSVVDLHREDLRKALGLRKATGLVEERELWTATSEFFNGRERPTSYSIYPLPAPKRLVVEASSNVTAKPVVRAPRETYRQSADGG